ncbi:MAG: STY4528 family pathogenicity island replication protein [Candidatus Sedimenticola sp. (ex Thyasira tokunagai)]
MSSNTDNTDISPRIRGITALVEEAVTQLRAREAAPFEDNEQSETNEERGALLYFGNWQDPIPRLLILDRALDASDVRLWAYLRTLFTQPGMPTVFPGYREIQQDLPMARATLAGCISTLRATRWITRCTTVRDAKGRFKGNIYALHEEPLSLADTLHLDNEYMTFLARATQHGYKRVRTIASAVLDTIRDRIGQDGDITSSPSVLKQAECRLLESRSISRTSAKTGRARIDSGWSAIGAVQTESLNITNLSTEEPEAEVIHSHDPGSESELGGIQGENRKKTQVQNLNSVKPAQINQVQNLNSVENSEKQPSSKSELGAIIKKHPGSNSELGENKNLGTSKGSSSGSSFIYKKTTTTPSTKIPHARAEQNTPSDSLILPSALKPNERPLAVMQIQRIPEEIRQDVLDQLAADLNNKNRKEPVRDPVAYLHTLCRRVLSGEFELTSRGLAIKEQRKRETIRQQHERQATETHARRLEARLENLRRQSEDEAQ